MTYHSDGDETGFDAMIADEDDFDRVEAGASTYHAEAAMRAPIDEYVEHLRTVGIEQLLRRPRAKRVPAGRHADTATLPAPARSRPNRHRET